ncbi:hypothetical protein Tco_1526387 [Tanacetum coccineum]
MGQAGSTLRKPPAAVRKACGGGLKCLKKRSGRVNPPGAAETRGFSGWSTRVFRWRVASRITWLKHGDKNSKFFHLVHRIRKNRNSIVGLNINSQWVVQSNIIKEHIVNHLSNLFSKENRDYSWFPWDDLELMKLPTELYSVLEEDMSIEAWRAIKDCEGDKAPGPHGFTIGFIKFAWKIIKEDFGKMLTEFSNNASLPKGFNSSFTVLIPKANKPKDLKHLRPISLINAPYKIISKILVQG